MYAVGIHLYAVLVTPLVALLSDAVAHHRETVESQTAYHGLRYSAASGDLSQSRLLAQCVDDVGGGCGVELLRTHVGHGYRRVPQQAFAREAPHHNLIEQGGGLFHPEVGLLPGVQVYLIYNGLVTYVGHLHCHHLLWQVGETIISSSVRRGGCAQFGYHNAYADKRAAVDLIGYVAAKRGLGHDWFCAQAKAQHHHP